MIIQYNVSKVIESMQLNIYYDIQNTLTIHAYFFFYNFVSLVIEFTKQQTLKISKNIMLK